MNRKRSLKRILEETWYRAGARFSAAFLNTGTDEDRIRGATFGLAVAAGVFAVAVFRENAWAVTDLNGAASNLQTGFQSAGRALYYGIGATGLATAAGGIMAATHAHKHNQSAKPGLAAAGAGAAMTGIGTYMAFFNQTAMQDTGGMSTNAMGIPQ